MVKMTRRFVRGDKVKLTKDLGRDSNQPTLTVLWSNGKILAAEERIEGAQTFYSAGPVEDFVLVAPVAGAGGEAFEQYVIDQLDQLWEEISELKKRHVVGF